MTKRPIDYRPPDLIVAILGYVLDDDDPNFTRPEEEVFEFLGLGEWSLDTVRRAIRELEDFGALRRVTPIRGDTRPKLRLTVLGRAWIDRRLERYVRPDVDEPDPDPPDATTLDVD